MERENEPDTPKKFTPHFIDAVVDILVAARQTGTRLSIYEMIVSNEAFVRNLEGLVNCALRLNKTLGEDIISADLEPANERPDGMWDESTMDEAFGDARTKTLDDRVLCAVELGLRKVEKVLNGGEPEWHDTSLLKPKVVLTSFTETPQVGA